MLVNWLDWYRPIDDQSIITQKYSGIIDCHRLGFESFSWSNSLLHCLISWIVTSSQDFTEIRLSIILETNFCKLLKLQTVNTRPVKKAQVYIGDYFENSCRRGDSTVFCSVRAATNCDFHHSDNVSERVEMRKWLLEKRWWCLCH